MLDGGVNQGLSLRASQAPIRSSFFVGSRRRDELVCTALVFKLGVVGLGGVYFLLSFFVQFAQ